MNFLKLVVVTLYFIRYFISPAIAQDTTQALDPLKKMHFNNVEILGSINTAPRENVHQVLAYSTNPRSGILFVSTTNTLDFMFEEIRQGKFNECRAVPETKKQLIMQSYSTLASTIPMAEAAVGSLNDPVEEEDALQQLQSMRTMKLFLEKAVNSPMYACKL